MKAPAGLSGQKKRDVYPVFLIPLCPALNPQIVFQLTWSALHILILRVTNHALRLLIHRR